MVVFCCGGVGEVKVGRGCGAKAPAKTKNTKPQRAYKAKGPISRRHAPYLVRSSFHYRLHDTCLLSLASLAQSSIPPLTPHISTYQKGRVRKSNTTTIILIRTPGLLQKPQKNQPPFQGTPDASNIQHGKEINEQFLYITA